MAQITAIAAKSAHPRPVIRRKSDAGSTALGDLHQSGSSAISLGANQVRESETGTRRASIATAPAR